MSREPWRSSLAVCRAAASWACRPPVNARLGKTVGTVQAATVSFFVGTVVLLAIAGVVNGGLGSLGQIGKAPWWALVGGPARGRLRDRRARRRTHARRQRRSTAAVITGQLAISVVIDRYGLLGIAKQHDRRRNASSGWCCSSPASCSSCAAEPESLLKKFTYILPAPGTEPENTPST